MKKRISEISNERFISCGGTPLSEIPLSLQWVWPIVILVVLAAAKENYKFYWKEKSEKHPWFDVPFIMNVTTNIGRSFLKILDKESPENHLMHEIYSRNTIKIIYTNDQSCAR